MESAVLLEWYRPRRWAYPWRTELPDPYLVLVSEVMLQQTQAARVAPAFRAFVERFPSIQALSEASRPDVLRAWSGLGYNRRAVALQQAAREVVRCHSGSIPRDREALRTLPGVGPYTASAVAAVAFGEPIPALDVNVRRVAARARLGLEPGAAGARAVERAAAEWLDGEDPVAWNQAVMDLGREVCRPRGPRCDRCPVAPSCRYRQAPATARRSGRGASRPQPRFQGSFRQVRGAVLRTVLARSPLTLRETAALTGHPLDLVAEAVRARASAGFLRAGPAALAGRPGGKVRPAP